MAPGGFANSVVQDSFCANTTCVISIIYDQSPQGNHLTKAPHGADTNPNLSNEASATALKLTIGGHTVYGDPSPAQASATGGSIPLALPPETSFPETEYMVTSGNYYNAGCCFDYGNAETKTITMTATARWKPVYFPATAPVGDVAPAPWSLDQRADLENGLFAGQSICSREQQQRPPDIRLRHGAAKRPLRGALRSRVVTRKPAPDDLLRRRALPRERLQPYAQAGGHHSGVGRGRDQRRSGELLRGRQ